MTLPFVATAAKIIFFTMKKLFGLDKATKMASVELWVVTTTLLLVVRFLIDFSGPWYSNVYKLATVQIIQLLNYNMVQYTLGLMQLSAARVNDYFQAWAVLMVTLQYSVKIGRPYGRSNQIPVLDLMSSLWTANLLNVQTVYRLKSLLWIIWSVNAARMIAYFLFSDMSVTRNEENARLVCDYMRYEHTLSETTNADSMSGYKYLVFGEDQQKMKREPGKFSLAVDVEHRKLITVEKIWDLDDSRLLGKEADPEDRLKDVCLSFALYKLLRRRFYDLPIHEAEQDKTKKLVLEGILNDKDDYERVFRITGVELSFLQDLFHSKHAQMFVSGFRFPVYSVVLSLVLVGVTGYIAYPVREIPQRIDPADRSNITHGVAITRFIVALIIGKEISEIIMYVFSQWTKVLMICMHIKSRSFWRCWLVEKAMKCMFKLIRKGTWKQKIRQYNLLISSGPMKLLMARLFPTNINLETEVKQAILEALKGQVEKAILESLKGPQTFKGLNQNPERSEAYFSNAFGSKEDLMQGSKKEEDLMQGSKKEEDLMQQLEWAIDLEADTHRILVWHIATCLCEINLSDDANALKAFWLKPRPFVNKSRSAKDVWKHYITASSLSNYCAYLLTKRLVPDNGIVVNKVFSVVRMETNKAISRPGMSSLLDIFKTLMKKTKGDEKPMEESGQVPEVKAPVTMGDDSIVNEEDPEEGPKGDGDVEDTIIKMGTRLGKQLIFMERYRTNKVRLWEDLAKFWTGYLLHLAANTGATKHKMHLAGSGELITHLWALLSHAGILGGSHGEQLLDPVNLADINAANRGMTEPKYTTFVT